MEASQADPQTPTQDSFCDSALGTPAGCSTTTIDTETWEQFRDGEHCLFPPSLPRDEDQEDRWDLLHLVCRGITGRLIHAPIIQPHRILDIGTTTGIWAQDTADENQAAYVLAWDKSPHLPTDVPPNLVMEQHDWDGYEWGLHGQFDVANVQTPDVHDWQGLFSNCYQALRPGGWLQCTGVALHPMSDHSEILRDSPLERACRLVRNAWQVRGVDLDAPSKWDSVFEESGFVDVEVRQFKIPCAGWPREPRLRDTGKMFASWLSHEIGASAQSLFENIGMSFEATTLLLVDARNEIRDPRPRRYFSLYTVVGRRPLN